MPASAAARHRHHLCAGPGACRNHSRNTMSEDIEEPKDKLDKEPLAEGEKHSEYRPADAKDATVKHQLSGMYQNWFLDYASYVILERAVPHIMDGLKPVQRRILHTMRRMEDGRYNKVANIVGEAMKFHPHGDASIKDALVQLGQKDMLIDCQGNWGNVLTGDDAAAARYIEARLTKFALDVVFNPKTTEWKQSYDGRNREPVTLPVKFPLLLAQGVEGIAVGLSSKILPHNFNELCDAAISYLHGEPFSLYPDFQTGGSIDVSRYNDGERGGVVRVRSKIEKVDNKTLAIKEIPYGKTVAAVCDSIVKASCSKDAGCVHAQRCLLKSRLSEIEYSKIFYRPVSYSFASLQERNSNGKPCFAIFVIWRPFNISYRTGSC